MRSQREHRRPRATTVFCTVGWLLPLALGCRLTDADEVDRTPNAVRSGGGTDGGEHKTMGYDAPEARADAPAFPEVGPPRYRPDVAPERSRGDATRGIDGGAAIIDAGEPDPIPRRIDEGSASGDDLDQAARRDGPLS
jgi:hypothetical protein